MIKGYETGYHESVEDFPERDDELRETDLEEENEHWWAEQLDQAKAQLDPEKLPGISWHEDIENTENPLFAIVTKSVYRCRP